MLVFEMALLVQFVPLLIIAVLFDHQVVDIGQIPHFLQVDETIEIIIGIV